MSRVENELSTSTALTQRRRRTKSERTREIIEKIDEKKSETFGTMMMAWNHGSSPGL